MFDREEIVARIRKIMQQEWMTDAQAAREIGISWGAMKKLLDVGTPRVPHSSTFLKIRDFLKKYEKDRE